MMKRVLVFLRARLSGKRLAGSIKKNSEAADALDGILREVMKR